MLWSEGVTSWDEFCASPKAVGKVQSNVIVRGLEQAEQSLADRNHQFFANCLGGAEAWRAWPHFRDSVAFVDIETDGRNSPDAITCIGLYDGTTFRCFVRNANLHDFADTISHYAMIVTFYGSGFDLPMIKRHWPTITLDQIHIDLCPTLKRLGLRGGLKKIEKELGLERSEDTNGLNGQDAIRLWRQWERSGNSNALETLIAYNREDVVNLEVLAGFAFDHLREATLGPFLKPSMQA
jgi:uncharacterized protein YprB with RNaseH-like and TPR domain